MKAMSDKPFPKLHLPFSKPGPSAKQRSPAPKAPSELLPAQEPPYALTIHEIAAEEMRAGRNDAAVLEAMMVRITSDDALFRRIAVPLLRKRCHRHIKGVRKQIKFQEAVAKAIAQGSDSD
jgi:hypothetical protein